MAETASYWSDTFTDRRGNVHALAKLSVFVDGTSTPATLYTDETKLTVAADHVVDVDGDGKAEFYADPAFYSYELSRAGAVLGTGRLHVGVQKGAQGEPGVVWQGDWVSTTAYAVDDVVAYAGSTWVAVAASTGVTPSGAAAEWDLFTAQGDTGPQGEQGIQGEPGLVWRGDWVSTTDYVVDDAVTHGGASWVAVTDPAAGAEPGVDAAWDVLAERGTDGEGTPATVASPGVTAAAQAGAVGASTDLARQDHEHPSDGFEVAGAVATHEGAADPHDIYVNVSGDTMTGDLNIQNAQPQLRLYETDSADPGGYYRLQVATDTAYLQWVSSAAIVTNLVRFNQSSQVLLSDGSPTAPSLSFAADPDTGIYNPLDGGIYFALNGVRMAALHNDRLSLWGAKRITDGDTGDNLFVSRGGDSMAGDLRLDGTNIVARSPNTTGGWARGIGLFNTDGLTQWGGVGHYGATDANGAQFLSWVYLGAMDNPHSNYGLMVRAGTRDVEIGGQLLSIAGSVTTPGIAFAADANTGIYRAGSDNLGFAVGGARRASLIAGNFHPDPDNVVDLGHPSFRWNDVFAGNGTIQTSDVNEKADVAPITGSAALDRVLRTAANAIQFKWRNGTRTHAGFSAQGVGTEHGTDTAAYIDPSVEANARTNPYAAAEPTAEWYADYVDEDDDPDEQAEQRAEAEAEWVKARDEFDAETQAMLAAPKGIRPAELIPDLYAAMAEQQAVIDQQATTIADLVARVEALETHHP